MTLHDAYEFSPRQWATVRAALRFWLAAVETSRVHPSRHPAAAAELLDHGCMEADEIECFLAANDEHPQYITTTVLAKELGVSRAWVSRLLHDVPPDLVVGPTQLYKRERVKPRIRKAVRRGRRRS